MFQFLYNQIYQGRQYKFGLVPALILLGLVVLPVALVALRNHRRRR